MKNELESFGKRTNQRQERISDIEDRSDSGERRGECKNEIPCPKGT